VGVIFSAPVQTGPGYHPASYTMVSFPGVKRPELGVDHPSPSSVVVKEGLEMFIYSSSIPSWPLLWCPLPLLTAGCLVFMSTKDVFVRSLELERICYMKRYMRLKQNTGNLFEYLLRSLLAFIKFCIHISP
jgi:hypothetical protein